jgi:hypothetical protein
MKTQTVREILAGGVLTLLVAAPAAIVTVRAQSAQTGMPDLVGALRATPGVLGVEAARTMSGKQAIFAWFENKKAALAWYYSDTHQALMLQFSGGTTRTGEPLAGVPDDGRPILAIASLTMPQSASPKDAGELRTTVTQIAIELYAPLPGGIAVGGRFAPSTVSVPGMFEAPVEALSFIGRR